MPWLNRIYLPIPKEPHYCRKPGLRRWWNINLDEGSSWQCRKCGQIWIISRLKLRYRTLPASWVKKP